MLSHLMPIKWRGHEWIMSLESLQEMRGHYTWIMEVMAQLWLLWQTDLGVHNAVLQGSFSTCRSNGFDKKNKQTQNGRWYASPEDMYSHAFKSAWQQNQYNIPTGLYSVSAALSDEFIVTPHCSRWQFLWSLCWRLPKPRCILRTPGLAGEQLPSTFTHSSCEVGLLLRN